MQKDFSACASACLCAVLLAACATTEPVTANPPLNPPQAFLQGVIDRLPQGSGKHEMANAPQEEFYLWGSEICAQLKAGQPENLVTDSLAEFFGPNLGSALFGSAKETICPEAHPLVRALGQPPSSRI
jgi:hypothetical protein